MLEAERRLRRMINPLSTAFAGWRCHSATRFTLTGYGRDGGRVVLRRQEEDGHSAPRTDEAGQVKVRLGMEKTQAR
jgi:hypothetical protein